MIKISELTPKGANLEATDLLEISEATADGYTSKSITGEEIINAAQSGLQAELVSGTNIKTINGTSLLGSGDLSITASASWGSITGTLSTQTDLQSALDSKQATLVSGTNIKTINGSSLLGSGDITISGSNIYTTDGTLTANRTLTQSSFSLTIAGTTSSRFQANGNVGIGTTTDAGYKLDVNGTARVQGNLDVSGSNILTTRYLNMNSALGLSRIEYSYSGGTLLQLGRMQGSAGLTRQFDIISKTPNYGSTSQQILTLFPSASIKYDNSAATSSTIATETASACFEVFSTNKGFLPPRMTTSQKTAIASPTAGLIVFDTTLNKLCVYTTTWETITSA